MAKLTQKKNKKSLKNAPKVPKNKGKYFFKSNL